MGRGLAWLSFNSLGPPWTHLDAFGRLDTLGSTRAQLDSLGLTWTHL